MAGKNSKMQREIEISLNAKDFPLETLKELIDQNVFDEELPFELLVEEYPSLLSDWYPGYPGVPRKMTPEDPISCRGTVKGDQVSLNLLGQGDLSFPLEGRGIQDGQYDVWLQKKGENDWFLHIVQDDGT